MLDLRAAGLKALGGEENLSPQRRASPSHWGVQELCTPSPFVLDNAGVANYDPSPLWGGFRMRHTIRRVSDFIFRIAAL